jgi:hypothetical protein
LRKSRLQHRNLEDIGRSICKYGKEGIQVYGTMCMVVCYNIRPSSLAVHRCETTVVTHRIGGGADGNISTSRQPYNTRRDETRMRPGKGLNKYLLLLVGACQEEESLRYDSFPNGRLAHCQTYRTYRIYCTIPPPLINPHHPIDNTT